MSHDRREGSGIVPEGGWREARYRAEKKREAVVQPAEGGGVRVVRVRRRQQRVGTEDGGSGSISLGCGKKKLLWTVAVKKVDVGSKLRKS